MDWMRTTCGTDSPNSCSEWEVCFELFCSEAGKIVTYCKRVVDLTLLSTGDGEDNIADLQQRLNRHWPPHKFDEMVSDISLRLGLPLDAKKFREPRLSAWRSYLESLSADVNLEEQVTRRIERDLLDYSNNLLPIDGRDIMDFLGIDAGPQVRTALNYARGFHESGVRDRDRLLKAVREQLSKNELES